MGKQIKFTPTLSVGELIRLLRNENELYTITQRALAKAIGSSATMVCQWEKGEKNISFGMMYKVMQVFDREISFKADEQPIVILTPENLASSLKSLRRSVGLTREIIASSCDCGKQTICNLEQGLSNPSFELVNKYINTCGCMIIIK